MADFVAIARRGPWPRKPGPKRIPRKLYEPPYANKTSPMYTSMDDTTLPQTFRIKKGLQDAVVWPISAYHKGMSLPFVSALASGLLVAPMIWTDANVGSMVLTGYVAGSVVFAAENSVSSDMPAQPFKKLVPPPKKVPYGMLANVLPETVAAPLADPVTTSIHGKQTQLETAHVGPLSPAGH